MSLLDVSGVLDFQHNWIKSGWVHSFGSSTGTVNNLGGNVQTASPGFVNQNGQDYRLAAGSTAIDAGAELHPHVLPAHNVVRQYVKHQRSQARPVRSTIDIGAYER